MLEPWGEERADMRAALLAWLTDLHMRRGKGSKRVTDFMARDFLPLVAREDAREEEAAGAPSPERQRAVAMILRERFALLAGKPVKPGLKAR